MKLKFSAIFAGIAMIILLGLGSAWAEAKPEITLQPKDMILRAEQVFSLDVRAQGSGLNYQWYLCRKGETSWSRWKNMTGPSVNACAFVNLEGAKVRCVVSNAAGSVTSKEAKLTIAPILTSYTAECKGKVGDTKTLVANARGPEIRYQWYYRLAGSSTWTKWAGKTSNTCTFVLEQRHDGMYFDCRVTASNGLSVSTYSNKSWFSRMIVEIEEPENPLPTSEVSIYYLIDEYTKYISIPKSLPQKYDLSGHTLNIVSGESAEIKDGIVVPKATTMYSYQLESGYWVSSTSPTGQPGEVVSIAYEAGDTVIRVDDKRDVVVHVENYATKYANETMDNYLRNNIQASMTEYQKAEKCCQFVAGYDYGTESSSATGMIITGSGDCWASTDALIYMLKALGIDATARYAGYVQGAGSGHYNVIAELDKMYYIIDAGYVGTAPRHYTLEPNASPFVYKKNSDDSITITDYINIHNDTKLVIPDYIEGLPVTAIGERAFQCNHQIASVVFPKALKSIGDYAFYQVDDLEAVNLPEGLVSIGEGAFCWCDKFTEVRIPASVETIGTNPFWSCSALKKISVAPANLNYTSDGGVLYTKDMHTMLTYPAGKGGSYVVPYGVVEIPAETFACVNDIDSLTLPSTLRTLAARSFYNANIRQLNFSEGITAIPARCFLQSNIKEVCFPEGLKRLEDYAFYKGDTCVANLPEGLEYIGEGCFAGDIYLKQINIPASVKTIGPYAFALDYGWSSFGDDSDTAKSMDNCIAFAKGCNCTIGENAFSDVLLCVYSGSSAHTYAKKNNVPFVLAGENKLKDEWFKPLSNRYYLTDTPITPKIETVSNAAPCDLVEGCDYRVEYRNNDKPGTGTARIIGIGHFTGTVTRTFNIEMYIYDVLFDPCGGDPAEGFGSYTIGGKRYVYKQVTYGQSYGELPTVVRYGYRFQGWFTEVKGGKRVTKNTKALNNDTLNNDRVYIYAHWKSADENGDGKYTVEDDILYTLGKAPDRVYKLPAGTAVIDAEAFVNTKVQVVYLPDSITFIDKAAFDADVLLVLPNDSWVSWAEDRKLKYVINH